MQTVFSRLAGLGSAALLLLLAFSTTVQAQLGYQIRPGDTLTVEVLEDSSLNRAVLVLPDGSINFPLVGTLGAAGRTPAQVQQQIIGRLAPNFAVEPTVFVSVTRLHGDRLANGQIGAAITPETFPTYVTGEIRNPGRIDIEAGTTILQVLAQAGGLTRFAADKRIELRRHDAASGTMKRFLFSYNGDAEGPRISGATQLMEGDVIVIPERRLFE